MSARSITQTDEDNNNHQNPTLGTLNLFLPVDERHVYSSYDLWISVDNLQGWKTVQLHRLMDLL